MSASQPTLCQICKQSVTEILDYGSANVRNHDSVYHQQSLSGLLLAAENDCGLCSFLLQEVVSGNQIIEDSVFRFVLNLQDLCTSYRSGTGIITTGYFPQGSKSVHLLWEQFSGPRSSLIAQPTATYPSIALAARWLEDCVKHHDRCCSSRDQMLPPRVIDLGPSLNGKIRLIENQGKDRGRYVALSHCWGTASSILVANKKNLKSILQEIKYDDLAQNFKDAIIVTRGLGLRYLWIDSLCIIQDDVDDWQYQCVLMAEIYANAIITIAATSASGPHDGFLKERAKPQSPSLVISHAIPGAPDTQPTVLRISLRPLLPSLRSPTKEEESSGPYTRAWCFQERLLASRILSFACDRMYFECATFEYHETLRDPVAFDPFGGMSDRFRFQLPERNRPVANSSGIPKYNIQKVVEEYSQRALTRSSDRLPAFAGIARRHYELTGDQYIAGMWQSSMIKDLCWSSAWSRPPGKRSFGDPVAPSWSWASCHGEVRFVHFREEPELLASMTSAHVQQIGKDPYGQVSSGFLSIRGWLKQCTVRGNRRVNNAYGFAREIPLSTMSSSGEELRFSGKLGSEQYVVRRNITLLLLLCVRDPHFKLKWLHFLVLKEVRGRPDVYARIGTFQMYEMEESGYEYYPVREVWKAFEAELKRDITLI